MKWRQANRFFVDLYTKFSMYTASWDSNDKVLKYHLKYAFSKKLSR